MKFSILWEVGYFYIYNGAGVWLGFERIIGVRSNDPTEFTFN